MWTYNNKLVAIAINTESIQHLQFDDGTQEKGLNAIKSFKRGIFVNPTLDKKKYLSLLKIFHPDVSNLDVDLATQIATAIISAKDGTATVINPQKTNYQSQSATKTRTKTSSNYHSRWQQSTWSDWASSSQQNTQHAQTQPSKPPREKKDFETWLSYVPTNYWNIFGHSDTFERDKSVDFRIFKRCCGQYLKLKKQWLERDEFLYFLRLTRNLAKELNIKTTDSDGYPGYPLYVLDLAWQKISI